MTNTKQQYDVFLSFSSKDGIVAKNLWDEMTQSGLRVFWSDASLKDNIGKSFFKVVQNALEKSKDFVLVCTKESLESDWVQEEYETFYSNCYIKSGRKRKLIIYRVDSSCNNIPMFLKNIQSTNSINEIIRVLGGNNYKAIANENYKLREEIKKTSQNLPVDKKLDVLINLAESIANEKTDGHVSMLKFTTGWKVFLGTPNLDIGEEREKIAALKSFSTLENALEDFIANPIEIYPLFFNK